MSVTQSKRIPSLGFSAYYDAYGTKRAAATKSKTTKAKQGNTYEHNDDSFNIFCNDCGHTFSALPYLLKKMNIADNENAIENLMQRLNICSVALGLNGNGPSTVTFWNCPSVWDTGASFSLTPFSVETSSIVWNVGYQSTT